MAVRDWGFGPDDVGSDTSGPDAGWPDESETDEDLIDDPEALRRAEMEVAGIGVEPTSWAPTDADWVPVAVATRDAGWSLEEVRALLEAEGIPAAFDPFDPRAAFESPWGVRAEYRVVVPAGRAHEAARLVAALAAEGAAWSPVTPDPRP